jgi:hypothetical protein
MKKLALLIIVTFIHLNLFSQSEIKYKGGAVHNYHTDVEAGVTDNTVGNNAHLQYDSFFKNWIITFLDNNKKKQFIKLKYVDIIESPKNNKTLMEDTNGQQYVVEDKINESGILALKVAKEKDGTVIELVFFEVSKVK